MDTIVYFGDRFSDLGLQHLDGARLAEDGSLHYKSLPESDLCVQRRIVPTAEPERAFSYVHRRPVDALLLDTRSEGGMQRAHLLLKALYPHGRMSGPILRRRVIAIVGGGPEGVQSAFKLGLEGLGGVLTDPTPETLGEKLDGMLRRRPHGKIAICLAGGGIEGLYYEIGVLRALDTFLTNRKVVDFDFFCGISAGAIVGSLLANGIGPDELLRSTAGESRRIDALTRWDLFEPNVAELGSRLVTLSRQWMRRGVGPRALASTLARAVPTAAFSGRGLGRWLEAQLSRPGLSNSFEDLRRPLYVGATDQDTSKAALFGSGALRDVPIHLAVRASSALVPFYPPVEVQGRHYIDGAFSRTTNMRVAAQMGATLVILIDPLVPVRSAEAGYVRSRGGIFSSAQSLKALINGRFDKAVSAIQELHPDVAFHLFRPEGEEMRIMAGSPMKFFYRREVQEIAFRATQDKLRARLPQLNRDFNLHGVELRDPEHGMTPRSSRGTFDPQHLGVS